MTSLRARLDSLDDTQRQQLTNELRSQQLLDSSLVVQHQSSAQRADSLVSYIVAKNSEIPEATLRQWVMDRLPQPMCPAQFIYLDSLPRLPNGKLALHQLPVPVQRSAHPAGNAVNLGAGDESTEPSEVTTLCTILADLLGMEEVHPDDDFFQFGGDSIVAIQFVSRAREAGIPIEISSLTQHPSMRSLTSTIKTDKRVAVPSSTENTRADQRPAPFGKTPLTTIQKWFFSINHPFPEHWNLSVHIHFEQAVDLNQLSTAIHQVVAQYPALASQFIHDDNGWHTQIPADSSQIHLLQTADSGLPVDTWLSTQQFVLKEGNLLRFLLQSDSNSALGHHMQDSHNEQTALHATGMVVLAHHLILDMLSMNKLIADIRVACSANSASKQASDPNIDIQPVLESASLRAVALKQETKSRSWATDSASNHSDLADVATPQAGHPQGTEAGCITRKIEFSKEITAALLEWSREAQINLLEHFVAALCLSGGDENEGNTLDLFVETHGRADASDGLDTTTTMGWMTTYYEYIQPGLSQGSALPDMHDLSAALKQVKQGIRSNIELNATYLARHYATQQHPPTGRNAEVSLLVNYLGQIQSHSHDGSDAVQTQIKEPLQPQTAQLGKKPLQVSQQNWRSEPLWSSTLRHPDNVRAFDIEVNGFIESEQLTVLIQFAPQRVSSAQIDSLITRWQAWLTFPCNPHVQTNVHTPSDFPDTDMSQEELDDLLGEIDE